MNGKLKSVRDGLFGLAIAGALLFGGVQAFATPSAELLSCPTSSIGPCPLGDDQCRQMCADAGHEFFICADHQGTLCCQCL